MMRRKKKEEEKGYDSLHRVVLVMHRRCGASEVVDLIHLQQDRFDHVVPDQFEVRVPQMVKQIVLPSGEEIVDHDHVIPPLDQSVDQVGPYEPGPACHHDPHPFLLQPQRHLSADEAASRVVHVRFGSGSGLELMVRQRAGTAADNCQAGPIR